MPHHSVVLFLHLLALEVRFAVVRSSGLLKFPLVASCVLRNSLTVRKRIKANSRAQKKEQTYKTI